MSKNNRHLSICIYNIYTKTIRGILFIKKQGRDLFFGHIHQSMSTNLAIYLNLASRETLSLASSSATLFCSSRAATRAIFVFISRPALLSSSWNYLLDISLILFGYFNNICVHTLFLNYTTIWKKYNSAVKECLAKRNVLWFGIQQITLQN